MMPLAKERRLLCVEERILLIIAAQVTPLQNQRIGKADIDAAAQAATQKVLVRLI